MKYELDSLDKFITQLLRPELLQTKTITQQQVLEGLTFLRDEKNRIRLVLINKACTMTDDMAIQVYVRNHQHSLVYLSNILIRNRRNDLHEPDNSSLPEMTLLIEETFGVLEFLLGFIEKYFSQYFDKDMLIPENYYQLISQDFTQTLERIPKLRYAKNNRALYLLVADIIKEKITSKENNITYRNAFYLRELMITVMSMPVDLEEELLHLNFNDPRFYHYYSHKITQALNDEESVQNRLKRMYYHIKQLRQVRVKPNRVYDADYPIITTWIADWLMEEANYQEKSTQLTLVMPAAAATEMQDGKYELSLSVAHLGLLTRLSMDTFFSKRPVHKQLAVRMSKIFTTRKAGQHEDIASESLLGKFYKHDKATKEVVKDILIRMLNKLKDL